MPSMRELKLTITERYFKNAAMDLSRWRKQFPGDVSKIVAQIPARSGSTRIADKNIREVCGLPLMAYSILVAKALPGVDRVIVNTDSPRYAAVAERFGAEAPFLRPAELARDTSSTYWAYYYLFRHLVDEDYPVKTIITFMPTSPFRNAARMEAILRRLLEHGAAQTVFRPRVNLGCLAEERDGALAPMSVRRPEGKTLFKRLGTFTGQHIFHEHIRGMCLEFIANPLELMDIDTESDLAAMERVIEAGLYDFGLELP